MATLIDSKEEKVQKITEDITNLQRQHVHQPTDIGAFQNAMLYSMCCVIEQFFKSLHRNGVERDTLLALKNEMRNVIFKSFVTTFDEVDKIIGVIK